MRLQEERKAWRKDHPYGFWVGQPPTAPRAVVRAWSGCTRISELELELDEC